MTLTICPECHRRTIERIGGEWCCYCRGFITEVKLRAVDTAPLIRVIAPPKN